MKKVTGGRRFFGVNSFNGLFLENAEFLGCSFGANGDWRSGKVDSIRYSSFKNCLVRGCYIGPGKVSATSIDGLLGDMVIAWGTLFSEVVLQGDIKGLMLHGLPFAASGAQEMQDYHVLIKNFYQNVDFAIDMSKASFFDFSLRTNAVPIDKIKLNRENQVVLKADQFNDIDAEELPISDYAKHIVKAMVEDKMSETIYTIPVLDKMVAKKVSDDINQFIKFGLLR